MGKRKESFLEAGKGKVVEAVRPMSEESGRVGGQTEVKSTIFGISGRDQQGGNALSQGEDEPDLGEGDPKESVQDEGKEDGEEQRQPKMPKVPKGPTKKERQEHEALHIQYRSWCRHCVRGRARNKHHMRQGQGEQQEKEQETTRISMDYFFMSEEDRKASENPLFVMIDEKQEYRFMRAAGKKGAGEEVDWLIEDAVQELKAWGYQGGDDQRIIMKSDNEPAIVALREKVGRRLGGVIIPEGPARGESSSNGKIEEAGKTMRNLVKTWKDHVEYHANIKLEPHDPIILWMCRWAGMAYNRFHVGEDGKTPWERARGRKCHMDVVPIGEKVWYKRLKDGSRDKMAAQYEEGIWLGHARTPNEMIIGVRDGVIAAVTIKRMEEKDS